VVKLMPIEDDIKRLIEERVEPLERRIADLEARPVTKVDAESLVSARALAPYLGISEPQVRMLEKNGVLPSYRAGGRLLFKVSECQEAVRSKPSLRKVG
jgi:excisionase family DNA binding protein